jgi:hypothetical protein
MASPNTSTEPQHFFNAPTASQIGAAFYQAAISLAQGSSHLVQLYPPPVGPPSRSPESTSGATRPARPRSPSG